MALPSHFKTAEEYFDECLEFFQCYQHLYNFENTKVLSYCVLNSIDINGLEEKVIFDEEFSLQKINNSNSFIGEFFNKSARLMPDFGTFESDSGVADETKVPLGEKKRHEIIYLAEEIKKLCQETNCTTVVDFGSGLGYLDQLIYSRGGYQVLGLECNTQHYTGCKKRQREYHGDSKEKVKFKRHTITSDSDEIIKCYLKEKFSEVGNICLTGLHACADLTVDAMNLFLKIPEASSLIFMSCCYHKMSFDSSNGSFKHFPLSDTLKGMSLMYNSHEFLRIPFLRLATQLPSVVDSLKDLVFNLLARALIQLYADKYNYKIKRKKRKAVKTKELKQNFELYIESSKLNFGLTCNREKCTSDKVENSSENEKCEQCACKIEFDVVSLKKMWVDQCNSLTISRAAIFILIQLRLQPIFENFLLFDRIVYLRERKVERCYLKKIVNEKISPRCLALLVHK